MKEVELFPALKALFSADYEVFAEVPFRSKRPDIVLRKGKEISIVEMKTSLNRQLLSQVLYWKRGGICNFIYVAVPEPKRKINNPILKLLIDIGIGVIYINDENAYISSAAKRIDCPNIYIWNKALIEVYKDGIGGSVAKGGYMTRYKNMINQIKRYLVRVGKPVPVADIVKHVPEVREHYSSPLPSIRSALSDFESHWCKKEYVKGKVYFHAEIERTPIKERTL